MRTVRRLNLIWFTIAAIFIASVFALVFMPDCYAVAIADNEPSFTISTENGNLWILFKDDEEISRFEGKFLEVTGKDAASEFYAEIARVLQDEDKSEYSLSFVLPEIGCVAEGNNVFDYVDNAASGFALRPVYNSVISTNVHQSLEYKSDGGNYKSYSYAITTQNGGLSFGQGMDAGEYDVRIVVYEVFIFDGKTYNVPRYSPARGCTILKATPNAPAVEPISINYGTAAKDISNAISNADGEWTLSANQSEITIKNGDSRLHVKDDAYQVAFDFTPHNRNYKTLTGVVVDVTVKPLELRVYVSDAYSLVGAPLVEDFAYELATPLVDGDSEQDLGVELVCEGLNANVAGEYIITARFKNTKDYIPYSINYNSMFIAGGRYSVYATREVVTAPDGKVFYVMLSGGFKGMNVRVELVEDEQELDGLIFVSSYRFIFENAIGERIFPEQDFTVAWDDDMIAANRYAITLSDGTQNSVAKLRGAFISAQSNTDIISFFATANDERNMSMQIACTALSYISGALGAVLIILIAVYFARRRYFK